MYSVEAADFLKLPPIATDLPAASLQESNLRIKDLQLNITKNIAEVTELRTSVSSLPSILLSQVGELKAAINSRVEGIHSSLNERLSSVVGDLTSEMSSLKSQLSSLKSNASTHVASHLKMVMIMIRYVRD
jgi:hypothetical protein